MSDFSVPVIRIEGVAKHPNADSLSLVQVFGETVVFRTGDFKDGDFAIYVPVDAVVPTSVPGTEFLGERPKDRRIRAKRLRGVYSEGLLLPMSALPLDLCLGEGSDVALRLGIEKYEESPPETWGTSVSGPSLPSKRGLLGEFFHWCYSDLKRTTEKDPGIPFYDIEPYKKHKHLLEEGERVIITEKLHGTNARYCFMNDMLYVGSRNNFWRDLNGKPKLFKEKLGDFARKLLRRPERDPVRQNLYWQVAKDYDLATELAFYNRYAFYGEIYGQVQDLKYNAKPGEVWFRVFDIYDTLNEEWLNWDDVEDICAYLDLDTVPVLYDGDYNEEVMEALVSGQSTLGDNIREGIVVKPAYTRHAQHFGRVILKYVSQEYKLRKGGTECH